MIALSFLRAFVAISVIIPSNIKVYYGMHVSLVYRSVHLLLYLFCVDDVCLWLRMYLTVYALKKSKH